MLAVRSISLTDFGPFKGEQRIDFPSESGVSIIYRENMRGKTTLLNAIRYALFGKVLTRGSHTIALHQIGNWETTKETGKCGFKVVLAFEHEKAKYELTREHRPRAGVKEVKTDLDYEQDCFLKKDGNVLGPDQRDAKIAHIMPETVSRFFLFDGELLQQYEELLRNESEMGRNIKEAIERILGVPVLTNGRADLGELFKEAQKREAKAAQKNQKTQSLGNHHEALLKQRDGLQEETDRLKKELETLRAGKASKEELLRKMEKTRALLDERTRLQAEINGTVESIKGKEDRRRELLTVAWKGLLSNRIRATREALEKDLQRSREEYQRALVSADIAEKLKEALADGECSTCGQRLSENAQERISALVKYMFPKEERERLEASIQQVEGRIAALKQSEAASNAGVLQEVQDAIDELKVKKATAEGRLTDIRKTSTKLSCASSIRNTKRV